MATILEPFWRQAYSWWLLKGKLWGLFSVSHNYTKYYEIEGMEAQTQWKLIYLFFLNEKICCFWVDTDYCGGAWCTWKHNGATAKTLDKSNPEFWF